MNVTTFGRSAGCLKAALRHTRSQRAQQRAFATVVTPTPEPNSTPKRSAFSARQRDDLDKISRFQLYPGVPSVKAKHANPMPALRQQQIQKLDPTGARTRMFSKELVDSAKVGDVLMVTPKQGEPFSGAFIQIRRQGVDTAILLRGQLMKTGVERWFKIYSPTTTAIDIIWRRPKRARRARLTYMRQRKHDMGNVDTLVSAWKKQRYALRSKDRAKGGQMRK